MNVGDAKRIAREWAHDNLQGWPRVVGAVLAGSINEKADAAPWPGGSDVDVWVFQDGEPTKRPPKFAHAGLIFEVSTKPAGLLADDARVLDDPHLAPHIADGQFVYDPAGTLAALADRVRPRFAGLDHIRARMKWAADNSRSKYGWCVKAEGDALVGPLCVFVLGVRNAAALSAIAALRNPTLRRCMAVQRDVLRQHGFGDLHDKALAIVGSDRLSQNAVREMLRPLPDLFRRACAVARTPFWALFELELAAESMFVDGTREMVEAGDHREAVLFILFIHYFCHQAIANDGTAEDKAASDRLLRETLAILGIHNLADMQRRSGIGLDLLPRIADACDVIATRSAAG